MTGPPAGSVRDWLDRRASETPDRESHVFPATATGLTWAGLRELARATAARLAGLGVGPGESVAYLAPNGPTAIACLFGCLYGGFRATPINLVAGAAGIGHALEHSKAPVAISCASQRSLLDEALALCAARPRIVAADEDGGIDWPAPASDLPPPPAPGAHALLMYTSGTTGRPKGVLHSHASLLAGGWTPALAHALTPDDRALCVLPLYHINGLCVTVVGPLVSGGSVVLPPRFSASGFWRLAGETGATWFSAVPTIISHLLHGDPGNDPTPETVARLRFGRSASAPLPPDVHEAFEARFKVPIIETMGLTETAAQILSNPLPPGHRKIGSPGVAIGNEAMIDDGHGREAARGEAGELLVRGPNVMLGYLDNPEATAETFTADGWLRTGDLGRMDADGYVFITGRLKELIIKGGENIAPREIDEALHGHADVIEAAAFARACPRYGQTVEAAVRVRGEATVSEAELMALCRTRLGAFKSPDRIHFLAELPKGPSGKIQRIRLAELTAAPAAKVN